MDLEAETQCARFQELVLPHLDAAYNLARWLVKNSTDAEDLVQEAYLRAWKAFAGFRGTDARGWLLTIVRNACFTWLRDTRRFEPIEFDEELHSERNAPPGPAELLAQQTAQAALEQALAELPTEFREVIVLRELEQMSYKEIGVIAGVPIGTVMSRLAQARARLHACLTARAPREV
jgi:RNA polymerase sigma-70 factor, ECF subfamily